MKKILFLIFILCAFSVSVFSQRKTRKIIFEDKCHVVIEEYRNFFENDSLAIKEFRDDYVIDTRNISSMGLSQLFSKKPSEIIAFFNTDAGKKHECYIKGYRNRYDLLE